MIKIQGNAKINLSLDILGKREDGFHEVSMVMQTIGLHDTIVLRKRESGIALTINVPWLRADASNLAWRAASLMLKETGCRGGVEIGDYVQIGENCVILPGVTIGRGAIVGAGAIVTKDLPPYCVAAGNPARVIKQL